MKLPVQVASMEHGANANNEKMELFKSQVGIWRKMLIYMALFV